MQKLQDFLKNYGLTWTLDTTSGAQTLSSFLRLHQIESNKYLSFDYEFQTGLRIKFKEDVFQEEGWISFQDNQLFFKKIGLSDSHDEADVALSNAMFFRYNSVNDYLTDYYIEDIGTYHMSLNNYALIKSTGEYGDKYLAQYEMQRMFNVEKARRQLCEHFLTKYRILVDQITDSQGFKEFIYELDVVLNETFDNNLLQEDKKWTSSPINFPNGD